MRESMPPREAALALGIVVGLRAEHDLVRSACAAVRVECARGATNAGNAAEDLCRQGVMALVSFGIAGAAAPHLASGDLLVPHTVRWRQRDYATDARLRGRMAHVAVRGTSPAQGIHAGVDAVLAQVADKRALFERTGALALDEESGALAAVACAHDVPFVVVRAVADSAARALPVEVTHWADAAGRTRHTRVLGDVLRRPALLLELPRIARDFGRALATLRQCRDAVLGMQHADN